MVTVADDLTSCRADYERDGVIRVRGLFSPAEVSQLRTELDRYCRELAPSLPATDVVYESDGRSIRNLWRMVRHDAFFGQLGEADELGAIAGLLVNGDPLLVGVETFNKPPNVGSGVPPHQDNAYFCLEPADALTVWVALDAATVENGPVYYVRGSHKRGSLPHKPSGVEGNSMGLNEKVDDSDPFIGTLEPGDALIHHCQTVHYSAPNHTDRPRCGLLMVFRGKHTRISDALREQYAHKTTTVTA